MKNISTLHIYFFLFSILTLQKESFSQNVGIGTATPVGRFHIKGSADTSQLVIDANFTQSNFRPLIRLRRSNGADLMWIHSDNTTNTFLGLNAGSVNNANGGATYNSFIGSNSGFSNTSGNYNTTNGSNAFFYNTSGSNNTAFGSYSLYKNISGYWNTANGESTLRSNTTGHSNTASGTNSLYNNSTGYFNTAIGTSVLVNNTTGYANTGSGYQALLYNNSGSFNNSSGIYSLYSNMSGFYNSAIGSYSLYSNSTGTGNIGVGHYALFSNSTGSYNTSLGYGAGCNNGQNPSNFTAIGYGSGHIAGMSNEMEIGNSSVSWIGGNVGWGTYSDKRIKDNIQSNVPGLLFINKLNPVTYNLNIHRQNEMCGIKDSAQWDGKYDIEKISQTGFLAQEVEAAAIESGYDFNGVRAPHGNAKLYSIQYAAFVVPLVKAVQELANQNDELLKQVYEQKKQYEALVKRVEKLESFLDSKK